MTQFLEYLHAHNATRALAEELAAVVSPHETWDTRRAATPSGARRIAS